MVAEFVHLAITRNLLHDFEQVSSPLGASESSAGQQGIGMVGLQVPSADIPGPRPILAGCTVASGQVSVSSWPDSSFLLCHPLLWHQQEVLGQWACAQEEMTGGRLRTLWTYLDRGTGGKACWEVCLPTPTAPRRALLLRHPTTYTSQASIPGCPSPSSPGTSCTETAPDGSLAWGQRPHCAQPWASVRLGHTEPFCPHIGVRADSTR